MMTFEAFPKVGRMMRNCTVTEKIDGTNAQICIDGNVLIAGSRKRFIHPGDDNFGFAKWASDNHDELIEGLGDGTHYGEWWGQGIQRNYGRFTKRFSLFNTARWCDWSYARTDAEKEAGKLQHAPECCSVVPVLYEGLFTTEDMDDVCWKLHNKGSVAAPGFMKPEGIMVWHHALRVTMKFTFEGDGHKG